MAPVVSRWGVIGRCDRVYCCLCNWAPPLIFGVGVTRHADHLAQTLRAQVFLQMHGEVHVIIEYSTALLQAAKACTGPVLQVSSSNSRRNSVSVIERHRNGLHRSRPDACRLEFRMEELILKPQEHLGQGKDAQLLSLLSASPESRDAEGCRLCQRAVVHLPIFCHSSFWSDLISTLGSYRIMVPSSSVASLTWSVACVRTQPLVHVVQTVRAHCRADCHLHCLRPPSQ